VKKQDLNKKIPLGESLHWGPFGNVDSCNGYKGLSNPESFQFKGKAGKMKEGEI
jgi:hypothetical protein